MEQQTAVEFLIESVMSRGIHTKEMLIEFEQAKEMEKEQIMIAYMKNLPIEDGVITAVQKAENYYNETFKTK